MNPQISRIWRLPAELRMRWRPMLSQRAKLGIGWVALCLAFLIHVMDEAATDFLSVYNPTVIALRQKFAWFPMPVYRFEVWLTGLLLAVAILLCLSPFAFRGVRWMKPIAYLFAVVMIANGLGHTLGTIAGRTVAAIHFSRPMPGFYSSPLLLAASAYLLIQLGRNGTQMNADKRRHRPENLRLSALI